MFHEGTVPHESDDERADEKRKDEHEELRECVRFVFGFDHFLNHYL